MVRAKYRSPWKLLVTVAFSAIVSTSCGDGIATPLTYAGRYSPTIDAAAVSTDADVSDHANALRHRMDTEEAAGDWNTTRSLLVWGGVDADREPYLEPSFIADALPGLPPAGNDFLLRGTTEDGSEAFSYRFDMPVTLDVDDGRSGFVFAIPVNWEGAISRIRLSGAEESFVLDGDTKLPMTILRDPVTGQVRAILRRPMAQAMGAVGEPSFEVLFSRGIPE